MTEIEVAVDLDGTIAFTYHVAYKLMGEDDEWGYEDQEDWTWPIEKFGNARFLSAVWHAWTLRPHEIPMMEEDTVEAVSMLYDKSDHLDVVSADPGHLGIKDSKRQWLKDNGVPFDQLVTSPMGGSKTDYDYDVFIDDNPHLPLQAKAGQQVLLYDAPYNQHLDDVVRIEKMKQALEVIDWKEVTA